MHAQTDTSISATPLDSCDQISWYLDALMSLRENELPGSDLERFRTSKIVIGLELPRDPETAIRQPSEPLRNGYRYAGGVLESRELISEPEVDGGFPH